MPAVSCIKDNYDNAIIKHCSERSCELRLTGLNNYVILKGEKICRDKKMCDCIIFADRSPVLIGVVELKSRTADPDEVEEKLTNGSQMALDILERCCGRVDFRLYPIVLSKSWRPSEYILIAKKRIEIRGRKYRITLKSCGDELLAIIV
ncbi:MAG: hypothetical protein ACP5KE_09110 [Candidatus Methanodesulfokora sp.]